MLLKQIKKH